MYLRTLAIQNVRNLRTPEITFSPGLNFISGPNGAGKTALLEAIHILSRGRSFRSGRINAVITHDQARLVVRGEISSPTGLPTSLAIAKTKSGETEIKIAGQRERLISSLAKVLPVQVLLPDAGDLVFAGPGQRRGFMDWGLFHVEQGFLPVFAKYRRVLAQRNAWLKTENAGAAGSQDPWTPQLIEAALPLQAFRSNYVKKLAPYVNRLLSQLKQDVVEGKEVSLAYRAGGLENPEEAQKTLVETLSRDVKSGTTHRGPHRSDLVFKVGDFPASEVLSRGQGKLLAGACILAQAEYLYQRTGAKCIFLVDDFGAELDRQHWQVLLGTLMNLNGQVIATGTTEIEFNAMRRSGTSAHSVDQSGNRGAAEADDRELTPNGPSLFHVEHGILTPVSTT